MKITSDFGMWRDETCLMRKSDMRAPIIGARDGPNKEEYAPINKRCKWWSIIDTWELNAFFLE